MNAPKRSRCSKGIENRIFLPALQTLYPPGHSEPLPWCSVWARCPCVHSLAARLRREQGWPRGEQGAAPLPPHTSPCRLDSSHQLPSDAGFGFGAATRGSRISSAPRRWELPGLCLCQASLLRGSTWTYAPARARTQKMRGTLADYPMVVKRQDGT